MKPLAGVPRAGILLGMAVMTALAGCGTLKKSAVSGDAADLVAFYRYAGSLDESARQRERAKFRNWVEEGRCSPDRIRLAMLTMHGEPVADRETKVSKLLAPCLGGPERPAPHLRHLAFLLDDQLGRRRELNGRIRSLEEQRDQLEARVKAARSERTAAQRQVDQLEKQLASLKEQLKALKDIERSIRQRD